MASKLLCLFLTALSLRRKMTVTFAGSKSCDADKSERFLSTSTSVLIPSSQERRARSS